MLCCPKGACANLVMSNEWRMDESPSILCMWPSPLAPDPQEGLSFGLKMSANVTWRQAASTQQIGKPKPQTAVLEVCYQDMHPHEWEAETGAVGGKMNTRSRWQKQPLSQVRRPSNETTVTESGAQGSDCTVSRRCINQDWLTMGAQPIVSRDRRPTTLNWTLIQHGPNICTCNDVSAF